MDIDEGDFLQPGDILEYGGVEDEEVIYNVIR
jgi:hypothetical protein